MNSPIASVEDIASIASHLGSVRRAILAPRKHGNPAGYANLGYSSSPNCAGTKYRRCGFSDNGGWFWEPINIQPHVLDGDIEYDLRVSSLHPRWANIGAVVFWDAPFRRCALCGMKIADGRNQARYNLARDLMVSIMWHLAGPQHGADIL